MWLAIYIAVIVASCWHGCGRLFQMTGSALQKGRLVKYSNWFTIKMNKRILPNVVKNQILSNDTNCKFNSNIETYIYAASAPSCQISTSYKVWLITMNSPQTLTSTLTSTPTVNWPFHHCSFNAILTMNTVRSWNQTVKHYVSLCHASGANFYQWCRIAPILAKETIA